MLPKPRSAHAKSASTKWSMPAAPAGTTRAMWRSATNTPSRIVSSLRVGRMRAEAPLLANDLGEREASSAQFGGHRELQIAGRAELVEVVREECVLAIVFRRAAREAREHRVGQGGCFSRCDCGCHRGSPS